MLVLSINRLAILNHFPHIILEKTSTKPGTTPSTLYSHQAHSWPVVFASISDEVLLLSTKEEQSSRQDPLQCCVKLLGMSIDGVLAWDYDHLPSWPSGRNLNFPSATFIEERIRIYSPAAPMTSMASFRITHMSQNISGLFTHRSLTGKVISTTWPTTASWLFHTFSIKSCVIRNVSSHTSRLFF